MELRHVRYFVAVAETGSLTAASARLNTSQPSLSRQMKDLEDEAGGPLFLRNVRGVELTAAGRVFLDHARVLLAQAEFAIESARRLTVPAKPYFVLGFLTGHESTWLPETLQLLRNELPGSHVVVTSQVSPQLAVGIQRGSVDAAFMRREEGTADLELRLLTREPLEVFMPGDHRFRKRRVVDVQDLAGEIFISVSGKALNGVERPPALRLVIDAYLKECRMDIKPSHEVDNLAGVMSLIASTRGVALLPVYAKNLLFAGVTSRPLKGTAPTIDLCLGYKKDNASPMLKLLVSRVEELISRVSGRV